MLIDKGHNEVLRSNVSMDASPIRILRTREKLLIILVWSQGQIPYQILLRGPEYMQFYFQQFLLQYQRTRCKWKKCKKCPRLELFWSVFSRLWTKFRIFLHSDWIRRVSLRIQLGCWKIRTRIIPNTDNFHAV